MSATVAQQFPQIRDFLEAVEPLLPAYRHGLLSYVAVVHEGETVILRARVRLSVEAAPLPRRIKQPANLRVGQQRFDLDVRAIEAWIEAAVSGERLLIGAEHLLKLLPEPSRRFSAHHQSTLPSATGASEDPELLQISGTGPAFMSTRRKEFERELNEVGFDSFDELLRAFGLARLGETAFEIAAAPVARIQPESQLQGLQCRLLVQLALALDKEKLRVIVRTADMNHVSLPHSFSGSEFEWTDCDGHRAGTLTFVLGSASVVSCRAVYAGRIQDEVRLCDPHALPNARRMIFNVIDPQLERLRELLTSPPKKHRDDFETAVALLLQMLGFAPAAFGKLSGLSGEPDIFAEGAEGEMLVVECTTDVPDDHKLMKLVSRAARARDELARSLRASAPQVLAMLIVPLPPNELRPIRAKAEAHDVIVLCRPEIEAAIARTEFAPDASKTLRDWRGLRLARTLTHGLSAYE